MIRSRCPPALLLMVFAIAAPPLDAGRNPAADGRPGPAPDALESTAAAEVAPGVLHRHLLRGERTDRWRHRVVIGRFDAQWEADALMERLERAGNEAVVRYEDGGYVVTSTGFDRRVDAAALARRLEAEGYPRPFPLEVYGQDLTHPGGPWEIHVLEADPERIRVAVAHARDAAIGLETTRSLAVRRGALAAVNGGYYSMEGLLQGDATSLLKIDGRLLSETDRGRAALGFREVDGRVETILGRPGFSGRLRQADGRELPVHGINRHREEHEIIVYTPEFHQTTLTDPGGVELVIEGDRVREIHPGGGSSDIPDSGYVISLGPSAAASAGPWSRGDRVALDLDVSTQLEGATHDWNQVTFAVGGGPLLILDGEPRRDWAAESISRPFALARHPRTALGVRDDGTLLFVTVDGRSPLRSVGMSLPELTDLLLELGAVAAINLDGGGSTTMVIEDRVMNHPSDDGRERWNGDALLLFSRGRGGS